MEKRFDHWWKQANESWTRFRRHYNVVQRITKAARCDAYQFAAALLAMQTKWPGELLNMVKSEGVTLDDWIDERFALIEDLGESRKNLLDAIGRGMTEKQYAQEGPMWLVRKVKIQLADRTKRAIAVKEPAESLSWREKYLTLLEEWRECKSIIATLTQTNQTLMRQLVSLERAFERIHKVQKLVKKTA